MDILALLLGMVISLAALPYVMGPLMRTTPRPRAAGGPARPGSIPPANLASERQAALLVLRDLDFDYHTGKIAEEDYQRLRSELLARAATLTTQQEAANAAIEKRIQERRAKAAPVGPNLACRTCGFKVEPGDLFCPHCGTSQQTQCPACRTRLPAGARFCLNCGAVAAAE